MKLESDISYTYSLLQIIKGDIRSVELIYNTVECLGNLNQLGFQRDRLFDESVADTVFSQLMKQLESPTADRGTIEQFTTLSTWFISQMMPTEDEIEIKDRMTDVGLYKAVDNSRQYSGSTS